ncbi:MAG TPA: ABC transporter permease [Vicinamibacterales bacterium]|nr:ABC transporter permease [Vicinamibacterales bacterium]
MRFLRQALAVTAVSIRTIPQRLSSSLVAVVGITGVVVVFVAVLSIGEGFKAAMTNAGRSDRAIIMRSGADSEMSSGLAGDHVNIIKTAPGILQGTNATPLASSEMFVVIDVNRKATNTAANVPLRGVDATVLEVRPEVKIVEGRMFSFGTNEVIVGRAANRQFSKLNVGDLLHSGEISWQIVGVFEARGSVAETEIWCDVKILQSNYRRGNSYQSVLVRLDSAASFDPFKDWLTSNPQIDVQVRRESEYLESQSRALTTLVRILGSIIAILMGIGAVFGAVLTMYAAVVTRTREIATLRALGFGSMPVLLSVIGESIFLALCGGVIGGALAFLIFNGYQTSTMNWQTFSQVAFAFAVTPALLVQGILYSLAMGLVGGIFPALRAARLPISQALREL